jgi:N-methylhydantoinase B/oxoprolinase/acetone carboxylase alpha subunit
MSVGLSHGVEPVWSLDGAQPGGLNQVLLRRENREEAMPCFFSNLGLEEGDEVVLSSASGGNARRTG